MRGTIEDPIWAILDRVFPPQRIQLAPRVFPPQAGPGALDSHIFAPQEVSFWVPPGPGLI